MPKNHEVIVECDMNYNTVWQNFSHPWPCYC